MININIIAKATQYIETNLKNEITILDVSKSIGYSLYHFSRLFHGVTGHTPKDYILRRRLTEAAKEIRNSNRKIIDIAFDYQFNDSETFTRAFKRIFNLNPTELRKCTTTTQLPFLSAINEENIYHVNKIQVTEPSIIELDSIYLIGLATLVQGSPAIITAMWKNFPHEVPLIKDRIKPERFYQVAFWPEAYELNGYFLMCGVEVSDLNNINATLVGKHIPPSKYVRFIHKGLSCKVGLTYKYIFETWLPKSSYRLSLPYDFEFYGKNFIAPDNENSESEIYIPIE